MFCLREKIIGLKIIQQNDQSTQWDENFTIIGGRTMVLARTIRESVYVKVKNPTLNMNMGKYNLHHI